MGPAVNEETANIEHAFAGRELAAPLIAEIRRAAARIPGELRLMEVCGTHTVSIFRHGIRSLLPDNVRLLSGPGCPVCVTPTGHIDLILQAARRERTLIATFGDMLRVPGSGGSLAEARARGEAEAAIVYSPMDALELARQNPDREIVFPGVGFETTAPAIAATILAAERQDIKNFSVIALAKTMPGVLERLLADPDLALSGLLCPGHVSAVIGAAAWRPLAEKFHLSCAVAGFEAADILAGILALARQAAAGEARVDNCYPRAVGEAGSLRAQKLLEQIFEPADSDWRGLGRIPASGLAIRKEYAPFDAVRRFGLTAASAPEPPGCRCGEILKGKMQPPDCPLFGRACSPLKPVGPCMVSAEGACAAWHRYGGAQQKIS